MEIELYTVVGDFAEDKDAARDIRERMIRPTLARGESVSIDFTLVTLATQSFIHALLSDILRSEGESALDRLEFCGCEPAVRGIIETVVQYSLETTDDC